jgi:hypothetical protein
VWATHGDYKGAAAEAFAASSTGNRNLLCRFCTYRVPGKRRVSLTAVDHFWTLKSTEYWVVSQVTFIVPPALGLLSIAMAS